MFDFYLDYARICHPFTWQTMDLRGHIGNVFATDRKKSTGQIGSSAPIIVVEEDDSDTEDSNQSEDDDE